MTLYLILVAFYLGSIGLILFLILAGVLFVSDTLFSGNPPPEDDPGWGDDYDPTPILPVSPEEEKEEDLVCV